MNLELELLLAGNQAIFFGVADSYCDANNIDLTKEGNNGRGPVDFKLSRGANDKRITPKIRNKHISLEFIKLLTLGVRSSLKSAP